MSILFHGTPVVDPIVSLAMTRPTHFDVLGAGGQVGAADGPARDGIPTEAFLHEDRRGCGLRRLNMIVSLDNGEQWQLRIPGAMALSDAALLTAFQANTYWVTVLGGGGGVIRYYGVGVPATTLGTQGAEYVDNATGDLYAKLAGAWVLQSNIKGIQGPQGLPGIRGIQGLLGQAGTPGNRLRLFALAPAASDGNEGDVVLVANGDLLDKTAGVWVLRFNIKAFVSGAATGGTTGPAPTTAVTDGIDITSWAAADVTNVYVEANWLNGVYSGPGISITTGPYKKQVRLPTATTPGWVYETLPIIGQTNPVPFRTKISI